MRENSGYSWTQLTQTWKFQIPRYFDLETTSLVSVLQSFTIGYFELPLPPFQTTFCAPREFEIAGLNYTSKSRTEVIGPKHLASKTAAGIEFIFNFDSGQ